MCWTLPQTDTKTVFNPVLPRQSDVPVDKNEACLNGPIAELLSIMVV
jgi:hypothetical protein